MGIAKVQYIQNLGDTVQVPVVLSILKKDILKMAETNVAGKNVRVSTATVFIAELSLCVACPMRTEILLSH